MCHTPTPHNYSASLAVRASKTKQDENTRACAAFEVEPEYLNTQIRVTHDILLAGIEPCAFVYIVIDQLVK